jgi:hypothetical protein
MRSGHRKQAWRNAADGALVVAFGVLLVLPAAWNPDGWMSGTARSENRNRNALPKLTRQLVALKRYPDQFEAYYCDHFGGRNTLISWLNVTQVEWLRVSSSPRVILGKNNWLFYTDLPVTKDWEATAPLTLGQLASWKEILEARRNWLAARDIRFLFVLVPEKQSIYPENLPRGLRPHFMTQTRLGQLADYLKGRTDVPIVDLREPLQRAKASERLYDQTDTHWNDRGAYVGYQTMMATLGTWFRELKPVPRSALVEQTSCGPGGDCARMLGLSDRWREEHLSLQLREPWRWHSAKTGADGPTANLAPPYATELDDAGLPRAVAFCDSFTMAMMPLLSNHFHRVLYIWQHFPGFDTDLVERERPDVVIQEMVERKLQYPDLVEHNQLPPIPEETVVEPPEPVCRTARSWSAYLRRER